MFEAGRYINQFQVLEKLGQGGMGAVYKALDTKLNREVAIKILPGEVTQDENQRSRFIREAQLAARVTHPHIMSIYEIGECKDPDTEETIHYIAMELVRGQTLDTYIRERNLNIAERIRLAEQVAAGLAAAHKDNVVHRDIKPSNVMITEEGIPKILDFGLAKDIVSEIDEDSPTRTMDMELTQAGTVVGTILYMSPEQATGIKLTTRSDIFSFGILLYFLFTDDLPFVGKDSLSTLARIMGGQFEPARSLNKAMSPELDAIVHRCLQKNPGDRYQNTMDLVSDLRRQRMSETGEHVPAQHKKKTSALWIGILAILVAAAGGYAWLNRQPEAISPTLETQHRGSDLADSSTGFSPIVATPDSGSGDSVTNDGTQTDTATNQLPVQPQTATSEETKTEIPVGQIPAPPESPAIDPGIVFDSQFRAMVTDNHLQAAEQALNAFALSHSQHSSLDIWRAELQQRFNTQAAIDEEAEKLAAVNLLLTNYKNAMEQRSAPSLERVWPSMSAEDKAKWTRFFSEMKSVEVEHSNIAFDLQESTGSISLVETRVLEPSAGTRAVLAFDVILSIVRSSDQAWVITHQQLTRIAD